MVRAVRDCSCTLCSKMPSGTRKRIADRQSAAYRPPIDREAALKAASLGKAPNVDAAGFWLGHLREKSQPVGQNNAIHMQSSSRLAQVGCGRRRCALYVQAGLPHRRRFLIRSFSPYRRHHKHPPAIKTRPLPSACV